MLLSEVWANCAETAAAVIKDREHCLALLMADPETDLEEIRRAQGVVNTSKQMLAEFTRQYLHEI